MIGSSSIFEIGFASQISLEKLFSCLKQIKDFRSVDGLEAKQEAPLKFSGLLEKGTSVKESPEQDLILTDAPEIIVPTTGKKKTSVFVIPPLSSQAISA